MNWLDLILILELHLYKTEINWTITNMGLQYWDKPYERSREELENERDLRVINTLYVIDWLQSATGKEALEIVEEESPIYRRHRLIHLTITLFRYGHIIPSDIRHNIDSEKIIKTIWGPNAKY